MTRPSFGLLMAAVLFVGCGSLDDAGDTAGQPPEVDEAQQAIYAEPGYGFQKNQDRCVTSGRFVGGECKAPRKKTWKVRIPSETHPFGCGTDTRAAILTAVQEWEFQLNTRAGHGWNVSHTTGANADFTITCDIANGTDPRGQTTISTTSPFLGGSYTCTSSPRGDFCRFGTVNSVVLWPNRICPPLSCTLNSTQVRTITTSFALHELMHVAGLGHAPCETSPLMSAPNCNGTRFINTPTDDEIFMLQRYNPAESVTTPL